MPLRDFESYLNREFGALPEAEIEDRAGRRASRMLDAAPTSTGIPETETAIPAASGWTPYEGPAGGGDDSGFFEDNARLLGAGVMDVAEMAVGAGEYVARQNKFTRGSVAPALEGVRGSIGEVREGITAGITPELLDLAGREFLTLDPERTIWTGNPMDVASGVAAKFMRSLPATLAVMLPAARLFRSANTGGALAYLGASEGGLSVGAIQNNLTDEIAGMSHEELLRESQAYARTYERVGGDEVLARQEFTAEAQGAAPLVGGLAVAAISLATGRMLKPVFSEGGMSLGKRAGMGFAAEFPQEGSQGASEQMAQNFAAEIYDNDRSIGEGVAEAFVQEGVIGGLTGGAVGGAFGQRPAPPTPPPPPSVEEEGGQLGLPGFGAQEQAPEVEQETGIPMERPFVGMGGDVVQPGPVQQGDMFDNGPMSDPSMRPIVAADPTAPSESGQLEMELRGRQKGYGSAGLPTGDGTVPGLPDALDQPTAEPVGDIQAQLDDMTTAGGRVAVYLSPEQRNVPTQIPKGAVVIPNFDGKGGRLIAKSKQVAERARKLAAAGDKTMQEVIGELTLAGRGKPAAGRFVVQLKDASGAVARESMVATQSAALKLKAKWGPNAVITTPQEAIARREKLGTGEITQGDPEAIAEVMPDMFDTPAQPQVLTAAENVSTQEGINVTLMDEAGNEIDTQTFATQKEADAHTEQMASDFPDAFVRQSVAKTKAKTDKAGLSTAKRIPKPKATAVAETDEDKTSEAIRAKLSLDQRNEVADVIAGSTSVAQAVNKLVAADRRDIAEAIDPSLIPADVTPFVEPKEDVGEIDPEKYTPEYIDDLASIELSYVDREGNEQTETVKPSKAEARVASLEKFHVTKKRVKGRKAKVTQKWVANEELDTAFEQAINTYVAGNAQYSFAAEREEGTPVTDTESVGSSAGLLESEYRAQYNTVGKKIKAIRREARNAARKASDQRAIRPTEVTVKAKEGTLKPQKTRPSGALTIDKVPAEESVEKRAERKAKVKAKKSLLRRALQRTKRFTSKFFTSGEYGVFIADNTMPDGSMTKAGRDFVFAREYLAQMVEFGNAIIDAANTSNDYAELAGGIASLLDRLQMKTMSPDKFATEWAALARSNEFMQLQTAPQKFRENPSTQLTKINKSNAARHSANERRSLLERVWKADKIFNEIIAPIFRKFSEAQQLNAGQPSGKYYKPTLFEIENLRFALRSMRRMTERYPTAQFYKPIKAHLEYYGFKFDSSGDLVVEEFSPSDDLLGTTFIEKHGISKKAAEDSGREAVEVESPATISIQDTVARQQAQDIADQRRAVLNIRQVNALLERLKSMVSPSKMTITGIKRQEQRFIRGLRKIGAWTDTSPGMGRISLGGYRSKTYRLVGPRLDAKTMSKGEAKAHIAKIAKLTVPKELARVDRAMADTTTAVDAFVEDNSTEFFLESVDLDGNSQQYEQAAGAVGDILNDISNPAADANTILDALIENLPTGFYKAVAKVLRALNMTETTVQMDWGGKVFGKRSTMGTFNPNTNQVFLNHNVLTEMRDGADPILGARAVHTVIHEIAHAATHNAIRANPELAARFTNLRAAARRAWVKQNGFKNIPYGLRQDKNASTNMPIDEFIVEAMSNEVLQDFLSRTKVKVDGKNGVIQNLMQWFKELFANALGMDIAAAETTSVLDIIMQSEEILFENAGVSRPGAELLRLEVMDDHLRPLAEKLWSRTTNTQGVMQRVRDAGSTALMNVMTMEQFVERFAKHFGPNLTRYMRAFQNRNARAAMLTHVPEKISNAWTRVEETDAIEGTEHSLEISRIGTTATLYGISADKPLVDVANEHLTADQHEMHADLHRRYNSLSPEARKIFDDTQKYYREAVQLESTHMLRSALRGTIGKAISPEEFDTKFSVEELKKVDSRDALSTLIGDYIAPEQRAEMLDTLYRMAYVPMLRKGNYFPATRYGEEVVYAERMTSEEIYEDRKEAAAKRSEIAATDPTLDVQMLEKDGKFHVRVFEREFVMAETVSEIQAAHARLEAEYGTAVDPVTGKKPVGDPGKRMSKQTDEAINSNAALGSILNSLAGDPAAQASIKNFYLRSLSDASFRKHEAKRKNRRGLDYDLQHRNLANYAKQAAYYTAQLEFGWKMAESLTEMRESTKQRNAGPGEMDTRTLNRVVEHLTMRDKMSADLPDIMSIVRAGVEGTHFFMLTSPSYWMINASQPWLVTMPTLAGKHGWGASGAAMGQIQRKILAPLVEQVRASKGGLGAFGKKGRSKMEDAFNVIDQLEEHIQHNDPANAKEYIALLNKLRDDHIIDINVFTEMRDVGTAKPKGKWGNMVEASRIMAHLTEVNNRVLTALTAYQLEMNSGSTVEEATEYAANMVSRTQFNYSSSNKPPLFQAGGPLGAVAPLMFQFMQWPQHMYAHLIRNYVGMVEAGVMEKSEARSTLFGLLGTHAAVGGMTGMMLQPIKWAFGFAMMALGDDDEPYTAANALSGRTFDRLTTESFNDLFGTTASTVLSKGLPAGLGIDLSTRMSLGTLYFIDMRGDDVNSVLGSLVAGFGGATLNQGLKIARGAGQAMDGDIIRGIETASPKMARDILRTFRFANEGLVNAAGDTTIAASDMSAYQLASSFFGFAPTEISNFYSAQNAIKDAEGHAMDRKAELTRDFRLADNAVDRRKVLREVRDFNRRFPAERITRSTLLSSVKSKYERESRFRRYGANVNAKKGWQYKRYGEAYRD